MLDSTNDPLTDPPEITRLAASDNYSVETVAILRGPSGSLMALYWEIIPQSAMRANGLAAASAASRCSAPGVGQIAYNFVVDDVVDTDLLEKGTLHRTADPMTVCPLSLAIWHTADPTAPDAAATNTTSPV